jgi:hypothetical protein
VVSGLRWFGRLCVTKVIGFKVPYKYGSSPTVFWLGGGTISLSCSMYMRLMIIGTEKYIQQNQQCLSRVPLRLRRLFKS